MGQKTKIDWCDSTWNPVTGCKHGCDYCYASKQAYRFGAKEGQFLRCPDWNPEEHILNERVHIVEPMESYSVRDCGVTPYPFGFAPTFHRYRLNELKGWKKPRTIFVCSMADLFGKWVPDEWIEEVMAACEAAPQHRYLFLTKNPARYLYLLDNGIIPEDRPNFWFGSTTTIPEAEFFWHKTVNTFVSVEPIIAPFKNLKDDGKVPASYTDWIIAGAETGNRKNKVIPEKSWIMELVECSRKCNTPIFMKESLRNIMGNDFIQEYPWEVRK